MSFEGAKRAADGQVPPAVPLWLVRTVHVVAAGAIVVLLALHTAKVNGIQVDGTSLGLLGLLLLLPIAPYVRRLRVGEVEAEIGAGEARELQAIASELPAAPDRPADEPSPAPTTRELVSRDPQLAMAQLRLQLERELRTIWLATQPDPAPEAWSIGMLGKRLRNAGVLSDDVVEPLYETAALANRVLHGEYVPSDVAREIATVGERVLEALRATRS